jgi:hypothetical protein
MVLSGGSPSPQAPAPRSDGDEGDALAIGPTPMMPPSQSSSKRQAHFDAAADEHDHDSHDGEPAFPHHFPRLSESGSSLVHAVSQLRESFSESVLDVAPPQVRTCGSRGGPPSILIPCVVV